MMPSVNEVRPKIWDDVIDLYDDGKYSAIWGLHRKTSLRRLGVRWNGEDGKIGYPNQGRNPVWYCEPEFLQRAILESLLQRIKATSSHPRKNQFIENIQTALDEC
jgi:hypothetical protein